MEKSEISNAFAFPGRQLKIPLVICLTTSPIAWLLRISKQAWPSPIPWLFLETC